ncbi:MAG: hypothetical protein A2Y71_10020 [Bacteroidetes bacterium RBG_13_42_15]|nr:MAG: hypothetical protein A2Y71_10020 [Bacteroidetes bacterium RBG_13_42_15]
MKKHSTNLKALFVFAGIFLLNIPLSSQEWTNMNPLDSLPVKAPWRSRDSVLVFSTIVPDPDIPGNNLLLINDFSEVVQIGTFRYDWFQVKELKVVTVLFRTKPSNDALADPSDNPVYFYVSLRTGGNFSFRTDLTLRRDNLTLSGSNDFPPGGQAINYHVPDTSRWHTYRVTMNEQDVKVYLDEQPDPVIDGKTYGTDPGADHFRIGKQTKDKPYGGYFDWFLIYEGETYAPGEGPAIPEGYLVDSPVGINKIVKRDNPEAINIFPNPSTDHVNLSFRQENNGMAIIDIYDITGQKVITPVQRFLQQGSHEITITTDHLTSGIYLLSVNGKYARFIKK